MMRRGQGMLAGNLDWEDGFPRVPEISIGVEDFIGTRGSIQSMLLPQSGF